MPPNKVAVTVARPNLPYSTASIHRGHPAAADEGFVRFGLVPGGALHRGVVQPDVGDVEAGEDAVGRGFPGDAEQHGWSPRDFFPSAGQAPSAMSSSMPRHSRPRQMRVAASKVSFSSVALPSPPCLGSRVAMIMPSLFLISTSLSFQASLRAGSGWVRLRAAGRGSRRGRCRAAVVVRVLASCYPPAAPARRRSSGPAGERRGHAARCRAGCPADPPVRRDSARCRKAAWRRDAGVAEKHARSLHADAATAVRMIHEDEFAAIGVRFFQRRELPGFGAEGFGSLFLVLGAWFVHGGVAWMTNRTKQIAKP
jgi:hypothetical protein